VRARAGGLTREREREGAEGRRWRVLLSSLTPPHPPSSPPTHSPLLPLTRTRTHAQTPLLQATIAGGCVTCNAHGSRFNLTTGAPEGEWCPKLPNLPIIGKGPGPKPLPTYKVEVGADGAISVDA